MDKKNKNFISNFKDNFPSGVVVFLVALPLCLGIALASGAPPLSGIIAGIVGGIVIGTLSKSHISVSGPAAGLAAIVLSAITELGAFELFLCSGLIAGIIQITLGIFRAGSISNYFPNSVIEGMLAGIGVIIILKQIPHALGYDSDSLKMGNFAEGGIELDNIMQYLHTLSSSIHLGAVIISLVSLGILLLWDAIPALKKLRLLPGALVAVAVGILLNEFFKYSNSNLTINSEHLVTLPVPKTLDEFSMLITFPDFKGFLNPQVWIIGATIAIVASIETLLCVEASDRLDKQRRITDTNVELRAQGIGNLLSSVIGGLPITSVVVRSSANANAGATTKMSSIIHGILLLICVLSIPFILNLIPLATLAAVLLLVGYKLASPSKIKHFIKKGKYQYLPFLATILAVVFTDLLTGVAIGLAIAIFFILQGNMKRAYYFSREELEEADEITLKLAEEVSFLNKAAIKKTLKNIQPNSKLTVDGRGTSYITPDVLELLEDFANIRAKEENIKVELLGFRTDYKDYEKDKHSHIVIDHKRAM